MDEGDFKSEIERMESTVESLKIQLKDMDNAEKTSVSCESLVAFIREKSTGDNFVVVPGSEADRNRFHSSPNGKESCCVVS